VQTAEIIAEGLGLRPIPLDGLREMDFGWSEGKPLKLVDPDFTGAWLFRPALRLLMALSAERQQDFAARIEAAVEVIRAAHPGGRVLVVTHWAVLSMLVAQLVHRDIRTWRTRGPWTACGISELHGVDGTWRVVRLNDSAHLKPSAQPARVIDEHAPANE
jgi:probable phosphoglycerate mutase